MLLPSLIRSVSSGRCNFLRVFTSVSSDFNFYSDSGSDDKNSVCVSETLHHLRRKPKTALFLITHLKESGFRHDLVTYMAIIRFFCYRGMITRLKLLFLDVIDDKSFQLSDFLKEFLKENNNSYLVITVDVLVKALISVKQFDKAYDVLLMINRLSVFTCNFFINALVEEGKTGMAMAVYKMIGFIPNVYTYGIVVKGLCKIGYVKEAENVIKSMEKDGVEPNSLTFGSYIHGLCSNGYTDSASQLLKSLTDVFAYSCVIRGFVKEGRLQDAENVLFDMKQTEIVPDVYCYGALIEGYCRKGKILKALDFYDEMCSKGIKTNCVIVSSIMQSLSNLGLWSEAVYLFINAEESGTILDEISFNIAIDALCKLGRMGKARLLLQEMKKIKQPDVQHYTTLIHGFCLRKEFDTALEILDEMINEMGLEPDTITFNVLIGGFAKCGRVKELMILLNDMVSRGLEPTNATYNIVIQGLCEAGKAKEALVIFNNNIETKSLDNYVTMMNGCLVGIRNGDAPYLTRNVKEAYELFLKLSKQGKERLLMGRKTGSRCLKQLMSFLCKEGNTDKALIVFKTIISASDDDVMMYSQLQSAYYKARDVKMVIWLFDMMIARGLKPDVISCTIMLRCYLRLKWLTKAHHLLKYMIDVGIEPDVICYTVLLDHYCKSYNLEAAVWLFTKMKDDESLKLDKIAYTCLIFSYNRHGLPGKALALYCDMRLEGFQPDSHLFLEQLKAERALAPYE